MVDIVSENGKCPTCGHGAEVPNHGHKPFSRRIRVRAVLLADATDFVIFGANNNTDKESYSHLVCGEWEEDVINDAAVIVEFDVDVETRAIAIKSPIPATSNLRSKP
jgi:hypothetical protein